MDLKNFDWKAALKTIAPTVASIFGTPLAGAGVSVLLNTIFPDDDNKSLAPEAAEEKLANALRNGLTPEQYVALKQADYAFQQHCADVGVRLEEIAATDRDSARKREMTVKDHTPAVLAAIVCVGFFGILAVMAFFILPLENKDALLLMIGFLGGSFTSVVSYYFGSSPGQQQRAEALANMAGKARP